jgi:hypothetical protein
LYFIFKREALYEEIRCFDDVHEPSKQVVEHALQLASRVNVRVRANTHAEPNLPTSGQTCI